MGASLSLKLHTVNLLGTKVFALRMDEVLDIAKQYITNRQKLTIGVVNVAKMVNMQKDPELRTSLNEADLVLADGLPIIWVSRMLGDPLPERVTGIDIMFGLLRQASKKHYSVYFLGAEPEVLRKTIETVKKDYPGIIVAGYRDGYFDEDEEQSVADDIRDSQADILFVGISSPKKENFLRKWRDFIDVPVCHGVGGSFDVLAGVTQRAPLRIQKCGMEWFHRLIQEPRRMWKRYLFTNAIFIKLSLEAIIRARVKRLFCRLTLKHGSNAQNENR